MGKKLYVGNLSFSVTDQELEEAFAEFGEIASATVVRDRYDNKSKGFGFVEFAREEDAQSAKEAMDGKDLGGRALKVDEARDRERSGGSRGPRSRGGYDSGGGGRRERY